MPVYNTGTNPWEGLIDKIPGVGKLINDYLIGRSPEDQIMAVGMNVNPARKAGGEVKGAFSALWDKKVRKTISDAEAKFTFDNPKLQHIGKEAEDKYVVGSLGDMIDHPELFEYYPELRFRRVSIDIPKARKQHVPPRGALRTKPGHMSVTASNEEDAMTALLHEVQHDIQLRENWAGGANSASSWKDVGDEALTNIHSKVKEGMSGDFSTVYGKMLPVENPTELTKFLAYYLHAGEIEARDTAMKYLASIKDRYRPGWDPPIPTGNIPIKDWIVRFLGD